MHDEQRWDRVRELYRRLVDHVRSRAEAPSWLYCQLWYLAERYEGHGGLDAIRSASPSDLLKVPRVGPKAVAVLGAVRTARPRDPWVEHAEMVAGVRSCRSR